MLKFQFLRDNLKSAEKWGSVCLIPTGHTANPLWQVPLTPELGMLSWLSHIIINRNISFPMILLLFSLEDCDCHNKLEKHGMFYFIQRRKHLFPDSQFLYVVKLPHCSCTALCLKSLQGDFLTHFYNCFHNKQFCRFWRESPLLPKLHGKVPVR